MTALTRPRTTRPAAPAGPFAHPAIHPDWLPPTGWHGSLTDGSLTDDRATTVGASGGRPPAPTSPALQDYPRNSIAGLAPTTPPAPAADAPSASPPHAGEGPGERSNPSLAAYLAARRRQEDALALATDASLTDPTLTPDDTIAEAHDPHTFPPRSSNGRETKLSYTALPLRHRIYALHCQGRTISAIARYLRLDRGTVARHLHAIEDLLLAEQTADLARLRLRAVEAQQAILAACWDALLCEELLESDEDNDRPYPPRRAQLLATAARAARTAAHLQGLFTPAALQAALRDAMPTAADAPTATVGAHGCAPAAPDPLPPAAPALSTEAARACNSRAASPTTPLAAAEFATGLQAVSASPTTLPAASASCTGFPREFNATAGSPATLPAGPQPADRSLTTPPAEEGLPHACNSRVGSLTTPPASFADVTPPRAGEEPEEISAASCGMPASATPLPRTAEGPKEKSSPVSS